MTLMNLSPADLNTTIKKFITTVRDVPFGNSNFQNKHVIINMEKTPERAYRHAALRILNRLQALNDTYYSLKKEDIEIRKLQRKLSAEEDPLEKELIELEIEKKLSMRPYTEKLINDALREIEVLEPVIRSMGHLSREQFEAAEQNYFMEKHKAILQGLPDASLSLSTMESADKLYDRITIPALEGAGND